MWTWEVWLQTWGSRVIQYGTILLVFMAGIATATIFMKLVKARHQSVDIKQAISTATAKLRLERDIALKEAEVAKLDATALHNKLKASEIMLKKSLDIMSS